MLCKFKIVFCLIVFLAFQGAVFAKEKVKISLLISLEAKEGKAIYNGSKYDVNTRLENEFRKHFAAQDFDISVVKEADLSAIWKTLHDPSVHGVFFIGHAGVIPSSQDQMVTAPSLIADKDMNNVKYAFQSVHSNLRYLALISCNAQLILNEFRDKGFYSNAPALRIKAFDKNIEVTKGLREAIYDNSNPLVNLKSYDELFPKGGPCNNIDDTEVTRQNCKNNWVNTQKLEADPKIFAQKWDEPVKPNNFLLSRTIPAKVTPKDVRSTLVLANDRVVAYFDRGAPGSVQYKEIFLSDKELKEKLTIVHDSGAPSTFSKKTTILGELDLLSFDFSCEFTVKRNASGEIMGIGKNIYTLKCLN